MSGNGNISYGRTLTVRVSQAQYKGLLDRLAALHREAAGPLPPLSLSDVVRIAIRSYLADDKGGRFDGDEA